MTTNPERYRHVRAAYALTLVRDAIVRWPENVGLRRRRMAAVRAMADDMIESMTCEYIGVAILDRFKNGTMRIKSLRTGERWIISRELFADKRALCEWAKEKT